MTIELEELFKQIESLDYSKVTIADLKSLINPILDGITINALRLKPEQYLYRLSVCPKPVNISRLTYPPIDFTALGRANNEMEPLFYASIGKNVPFFEVDAKIGDRLALSIWRTKKDIILNHIGYTSESALKLESARELKPSIFFAEKIHDKLEKTDIVYEFLSKNFTEKIQEHKKEKYKLTVAISNLFLASEELDGLLYPTIKMFGNSDNVAIKPKYVDDNLELVSVEYLEITNDEDAKYSTNALDAAISWDKDGVIEWSGRHLGWKMQSGETVTSTFIGNDWVTKGVDNKRIRPELTNLIKTKITKLEELYNFSFPKAIKVGEWLPIKELNVEIKFNIVLDLEQKRRWLSFYIPVCSNSYQVCLSLIASYDNFIFLDLKNEITVISSDPINVNPNSTADFKDERSIHFYSENAVDVYRLEKEFPSVELKIVFHT